MSLREISAAEMSSLSEVKKERVSRIHEQIVRIAVKILVEKYSNLDEEKVLEYVCGCSEEKLRQDSVRTWFRSGILVFGSDGCDTFLALHTSKKREDDGLCALAQEVLDEDKQLMEDMGRAYGIDFGPHEDEFFAQQVRDLRFDLLQRVLYEGLSVDVLAQQRRQSVAEEIANIYISEHHSLPASLRLLVGNFVVQKMEKKNKEETENVELPQRLKTILEERERDRSQRKGELKEQGVHPKFLEEQIKRIDGEEERGFAMAERSSCNLRESAREGAESIMESFKDDPRDVYDYFVDVVAAKEIISKKEGF